MKSNQVEADPDFKHRLHAICPYFAMFPHTFARNVLAKWTRRGDLVLDPFCGRGTLLLEALLARRPAIGCDINPVATVISRAKAAVPPRGWIERRLTELRESYSDERSRQTMDQAVAILPDFFGEAFSLETLRQLIFLRGALRWKENLSDNFLCAVVLGQLHGESFQSRSYFSNQMPRTISPKPDYAIRYWRERSLHPPERDVFQILLEKVRFRFEDEPPEMRGHVVRCDVRRAARRLGEWTGKVSAVVTSPPYLDVTSYEEDQWLRLWFLGGKPLPTYGSISKDDRHRGRSNYFRFLEEAWSGIAPLLKRGAVVVCRIGSRHLSTSELTHGLLSSFRSVWPKACLVGRPMPTELQNRQTRSFRPGTNGCGYEYDYAVSIGRSFAPAL